METNSFKNGDYVYFRSSFTDSNDDVGIVSDNEVISLSNGKRYNYSNIHISYVSFNNDTCIKITSLNKRKFIGVNND